MRRYNASPAFFIDPLKDACEAAFNSRIIEDVCLNLFSSPFTNLYHFSVVQFLSTYIMTKVNTPTNSVEPYYVLILLLII
jgi:hypothetical protein